LIPLLWLAWRLGQDDPATPHPAAT